MSWKDFTANKWTKFGFWALVYLLWVIWLGNFWWLFGLVVVFDIFITRKVLADLAMNNPQAFEAIIKSVK